MANELYIEKQIFLYLRSKKIFCWKNYSTGVFNPVTKTFRKKSKNSINGVSDILGCLPDGRFLAIEVKSAKGKTTPYQDLFLKGVELNNGVSLVAKSVDDVIKRFQSLGL